MRLPLWVRGVIRRDLLVMRESPWATGLTAAGTILGVLVFGLLGRYVGRGGPYIAFVITGITFLRVADAMGRSFPAGTRITQPQGAFVLWAEIPGAVDSGRVYAEALAKGILIAPGTLFSAQDQYRCFVRVTSSEWSPKIEAAVATVGKLAERCA